MPSSVVGAVAGGVVNGLFAGDAEDAQVNAANNATAIQKEMYNQTREDLAPWRNSGVAANNRLAQLMGVGGYDRDQIKNDLTSKYGNFFGSKGKSATDAQTGLNITSQWGAGGGGNLPMNGVQLAQPGAGLDLFRRMSGGAFDNDPDVQAAIGEYMNSGGRDPQKVIDLLNQKRRGV